MSGPPPKHPSVRARRNNPKSDFRTLSAKSRGGVAPKWPLLPDPTIAAQRAFWEDQVESLEVELDDETDGRSRARLRRELATAEQDLAKLTITMSQTDDAELALWRDLWKMPQAVLWRESHAGREVAQYVRWKIRAEQGDLKAAPEARQLSDRLGLNPLALLRLRAEVERADEAEDRGTRRRTAPKTPTSRSRKKPPDDPRALLSVVK